MILNEIKALEEEIADAVCEYLDYPDGYDHPFLRVYLDKDSMEYQAEIANGTEDDGIYPITDVIRDEDGVKEPDVDKINEIANS